MNFQGTLGASELCAEAESGKREGVFESKRAANRSLAKLEPVTSEIMEVAFNEPALFRDASYYYAQSESVIPRSRATVLAPRARTGSAFYSNTIVAARFPVRPEKVAR